MCLPGCGVCCAVVVCHAVVPAMQWGLQCSGSAMQWCLLCSGICHAVVSAMQWSLQYSGVCNAVGLLCSGVCYAVEYAMLWYLHCSGVVSAMQWCIPCCDICLCSFWLLVSYAVVQAMLAISLLVCVIRRACVCRGVVSAVQ